MRASFVTTVTCDAMPRASSVTGAGPEPTEHVLSPSPWDSSSADEQASQVPGCKDQREWQPGSQDTSEHRELVLDQQRNHENIHGDHDGHEAGGCRQSTRIVEGAEVDRRDQREDDRRRDGVNDKCPIERCPGETDSHRRTTRRPPGQGVCRCDCDLAY
jgi:hypothetical protein